MVDLVVVGAGTAGIPVAIEAADHGARVVRARGRSMTNARGGMLHVSGRHADEPRRVRVDADLRVLNDNGEPIRGLYAVGEILGRQFMGTFRGRQVSDPA
jgi:predicted oxidoreductase